MSGRSPRWIREIKPRKLPNGHTRLEYIQSTGTQWIDTDFKPTGNTKVICDFCAYNQATSQQGVFGSRPGTTARFTVFTGNTKSAIQADYNTYDSLAAETDNISGVDLTQRTVIEMSNSLVVDGRLIKSVELVQFVSTYNLWLFTNNNQGSSQSPGKLKLYSCKIYDSGVLIRDFVPCTNPSGAVGLYDVENDQFYSNAGSGAFTAGPEV